MTRSEVRKAIKENAKMQLEANLGTLIFATIIVGLAVTMPTMISEYLYGKTINSYTITTMISVLSLIIVTPLTVGLTIMMIDCTRGEKIQVKDLLKGFNRLYQVYGVTLIQLLIIFVLATPLAYIPLALVDDSYQAMSMFSVITTLVNLFFAVLFSQIEYVISDKKNITPIDAVKKATSMMKGHMWEYIIFGFSFIGWIILVAITFGIAYIWVSPYMQLASANFYEYIKEGKLDSYKKTNNKNILVGLLVGVLLCGYTFVEIKIKEELFTPPVVKKVIKDNNLKLISLNEESNYYISYEESKAYNINIDEVIPSNLVKYTLIARNHQLDVKKDDNIDSTVIYIITSGNQALGISCEPRELKGQNYNYNTMPGKYDINGVSLNYKDK